MDDDLLEIPGWILNPQLELPMAESNVPSKDSMISDLRAAAQYGGIDLAMAKERLYWKAADEIERLRSRAQVFSNLCDELIQFAECNCKLGAKAGCTCGLKPILERYLAMHPSPFTAETGVKPERRCVGCGATEGFTSPLNICGACEMKSKGCICTWDKQGETLIDRRPSCPFHSIDDRRDQSKARP